MADLTDEQCAQLNRRFYDTAPWLYFQQRLAHLVLASSDRERYRAIFAEGVVTGGVALRIEVKPEADDQPVPTPEQSFVAIESEVLLHHSAETLLRFIHAHAEENRCPWVRMASLTRFQDFKSWVRETVIEAEQAELAGLCQRVFASDPHSPDDLDAYLRYVRTLAEHFLDADSYNAAKHGMALYGGSERVEFELDGLRLLDRSGTSVSWLTRWPRGDETRQPRWTQVSRLLSPDAAIALVHTATMLMRSVWIRGRQLYLGEPWSEVYRPVPPDLLYDSLGIRRLVLADVFRPLPAEGEPETMSIATAHFELPPDQRESADLPGETAGEGEDGP